jgi:hypothetical protein
MAPGAKMFSFLPGPGETTRNVCAPSCRDVDERARWTQLLMVVHEHLVLAFEYVERLGSVVVDMHGWSEARWLTLGPQQRERLVGLRASGEDHGLERARVQQPACVRPDDEPIGHGHIVAAIRLQHRAEQAAVSSSPGT